MAIIDHFFVSIVVDGKAATEIVDEDSHTEPKAPITVSKFIEVTSGSQFAFQLGVLPNHRFGEETGLSFYMHIDGQYVKSYGCEKQEYRRLPGHGWFAKCDGAFVGGGADLKRMAFRFADLETRDTRQEDLASLQDKYGILGCLRVEVHRTQSKGEIPRDSHHGLRKDELVPEKALKGRAISVAAKLETVPVTHAPGPKMRIKRLDKGPIATFKFHYRTRASLQSEMIILRSPSPVEAEERPIEELTPDEMREIIRRQREQAVKVEDEVPRLKRERPLSSVVPLPPLKSTKMSDGKTVYHLDSDDEETAPPPSPLIRRAPESVEIVDLY